MNCAFTESQFEKLSDLIIENIKFNRPLSDNTKGELSFFENRDDSIYLSVDFVFDTEELEDWEGDRDDSGDATEIESFDVSYYFDTSKLSATNDHMTFGETELFAEHMYQSFNNRPYLKELVREFIEKELAD